MDSGAVDSPVTLVLKAPNQKYEDQTINCFLNWTVERLKSHISNVYPSKPLSKDQRLVYSGRLLQDHLQLRDVLRKQDGYHMMHLVCASHSPPGSPMPHSPSAANSTASDSSSSASASPASSATTANQDSQPASSSSSSSPPPPGGYDGLRYRGSFPQFNPQSPPGVPQWPDGAQVPLQGGLPANMPPHPMYMPMQMLWWQQMYARHYYMQYQAAVAASQPPSDPPPSSPSSITPQAAQPNEAVQPPLGPNPAPNPLPENQPANPNIQMNAQGGAVLNDDELNRDWLDWLYTVSRAGVLLSIVYFYSSFSRFVMVIGTMLLVYLHQAGWFPFRPEQQNLRGERQEAPQQEAERLQDIQEMERLMDEGLEDDDSGEEGGGGPEDQAAAAAAAAADAAAVDDAAPAAPAAPALPEPSFLTTVWSFISTFFTSLIPEGRPQPAN
ncbi:homocysteine-responsive endoplasmic reticulum-resident ubiquitin-like domain member 2 protein [Paralichthys olivaceus]|uniref:homocysteine-responsive endoplasmic reticulum-resident ubiquitin-like domain member 2 protein n=1 Tax=Paralichthys olivaceus TaxID=8255 RepID=UPI0037533ABA